MIFLRGVCESFQKKRKIAKKKGLMVKPIVFGKMNSKCQVSSIDYQSQPNKDYKFILVYQDDLTKLVQLRALHSMRTAEKLLMLYFQVFLHLVHLQ